MLAATAMTFTVVAPALAQATTVGNAAINRGFVDSASNLTYILDQGFGSAPGILNSFEFYAGRAGTLTPLLYNRVDTNGAITFTLLGIGTTRTVGSGVNTFDFGLTQGTALTGTNSYFGFRTMGLGVVSYGYQSSTLPGTFATSPGSPGVGSTIVFDPAYQSPDTGNGLNFRAYSINATTGAVPEPATWGMMIAGFGMMGAAMRTRRRSTKVSFA